MKKSSKKNLKAFIVILLLVSFAGVSCLSASSANCPTGSCPASPNITNISEKNDLFPQPPSQVPPAEKNKPEAPKPKAQQQKEAKKGKDEPPKDFLKREIPPLPSGSDDIGDRRANIEGLKNYKPQTQVIKDEGFHILETSLKDVSRLVCFSEIEKVIYSKEKGIEIKTSGRNAYIKNLPKESINPTTGRLSVEYDSKPKELYVICAEKTFSLILIPQDIPAVTAYLQSSHADTDKALTHEKSSTYEDTILSLLKSAYYENIPPGYEVSEINKPIKEFQEVQIVHAKDYTGVMYQIAEYIFLARTEITIDEKTVLDTIKPANPLAVSIVSLYLRPGDQTRVFIVRRQK